VITRLTEKNPSAAAKALGIHRATPHHWDNLDELEDAVQILLTDVIESGRLALENLALDAIATLGGALHGKSAVSIAAANSILDRMGLPKQSAVDVTSGGERLTPISFVEIVPPDDGS
jgi:antitoxin component of RelBE/YafQ-DinJ toxin-antitoxin module